MFVVRDAHDTQREEETQNEAYPTSSTAELQQNPIIFLGDDDED
jgi:hypothetical protein